MRYKRDKLFHLRLSIGLIYVWFGLLKFFENHSPAEILARETLSILSFGLIPEDVSFLMLAAVETVIGILLISNFYTRIAVIIAFVHLAGTFTPLVLQPQMCFGESPFSFTIAGQYIIKNIVLLSSLIAIFPTRKVEISMSGSSS